MSASVPAARFGASEIETIDRGGPHSFFKPGMSPLADCAQLVYVDLIGHGRSNPQATDDWTPGSWADSVDELCERIGLESPVTLGSSLGGRVAMKVGLRHRARPRALILLNTVGVHRADRPIAMMGRLGGPQAADAARRDHEARTPQTTADYHRLCTPLLVRRPYSDDELARVQPGAPGVMSRLVELGRSSDDLLADLHEVDCRSW